VSYSVMGMVVGNIISECWSSTDVHCAVHWGSGVLPDLAPSCYKHGCLLTTAAPTPQRACLGLSLQNIFACQLDPPESFFALLSNYFIFAC
jgi:hypothetical protein